MSVWEQPGIPLIRILQTAAHWATDQLVRWQPGAYQTGVTNGGLFESVYGIKHHPSRLETSDTTDTASVITRVDVNLPDHSMRTYIITITVCGTEAERAA
jgi:hypothetical protein